MGKYLLSLATAAALAPLSSFAIAQTSPTSGGAGHQERCSEADIVLPPGALYPNGVARASDGTLYVGLVTSGRILRKRPGEDWGVLSDSGETQFSGTSLRLDEKRGLLWGTSPDFLPSGKARPHRTFAVDVATGAIRHSLTLPDGDMGNDTSVTSDGTVYLTGSRSGTVMRMRPAERGFVVLFRDQRLTGPTGIGAAGIARAADGTLVIGNFGTGEIYVLTDIDGKEPQLREMVLPRPIENVDGMALAPDGSLIVLEGAIQGGDGKILRIADPLAAGPRTVEVVRDRLESPVNLTITPQGCAFVSESRIRHRLLPGREAEKPDRFRILQLPLSREGGHR